MHDSSHSPVAPLLHLEWRLELDCTETVPCLCRPAVQEKYLQRRLLYSYSLGLHSLLSKEQRGLGRTTQQEVLR